MSKPETSSVETHIVGDLTKLILQPTRGAELNVRHVEMNGSRIKMVRNGDQWESLMDGQAKPNKPARGPSF